MAASHSSSSPIVVDGVFFQLARTGIARVWMTLLGMWAGTEFGNRLVVIDRARTAPRVPGIRYHDAPALNYGDIDGDRRVVQAACDAVGAALFISTYYTYPITTPSVVMVYDMIPEVLNANLQEPMWKQKTLAFAYAERFTAISECTARDLQRFAGRPVQVQVDYTGCEFETPTPEQVADFKKRHGITRPYFMTSGSRNSYKNAALFFRAFKLFGDARKDYAIVCTGGGELDAQCRADAGDANVHVVLLDDLDLRCAYAGAQALIYPSRYEGFGLPVLEAMACECPVITSRASSMPEVGGNAVLYLDLGKDEEGQLIELLKYVQKPEVRSELIARGRVQKLKFTWKTMAEGVEKLLATTADSHSADAARHVPAAVAPSDVVIVDGALRLRLPATHPLPTLQRDHRLFQRLASSLGAVLDDGDIAVVAGAGHGNTLVRLHAARPALAVVAIEKEATRFAYLRANAQGLGEGAIPLNVLLLHAELGSSALSGIDGAIAEAGSLGGADRVRLICSDIGQGVDVIAGAAKVCAASQPMLFFTCQFGAEPSSSQAWRERLHALFAFGYSGFWLFDNFGNPIVEASTARSLDQALDYLARQNQRKAARTVYYYDVLAFAPRDAERAQRAVELHVG
ncbi:MAG: glycosyltransferase family 1 protein [Betaproteobacteria bacterium]